jgi:Fe2+ or Zn2+ uptake regulation protein
MMENIFLPLQRIIILQGLEQAAGHELSNEMIQRLLKVHAHRLSIAEVNERIAWLENRGYVNAARMGDGGFMNVRITRAGIDVAQGNTRAEGIDPPPEE